MSTNRPIKEIFGDRHLWPECISIGKPHIVYCLHCVAGIVRLSFRFLYAWSFAKPTSSRKWKTTFALPSSRWTSASTPFGALCETEWNESNKKKSEYDRCVVFMPCKGSETWTAWLGLCPDWVAMRSEWGVLHLGPAPMGYERWTWIIGWHIDGRRPIAGATRERALMVAVWEGVDEYDKRNAQQLDQSQERKVIRE